MFGRGPPAWPRRSGTRPTEPFCLQPVAEEGGRGAGVCAAGGGGSTAGKGESLCQPLPRQRGSPWGEGPMEVTATHGLHRPGAPCNSSCPGRAAALDKCPCSVLTCRRGRCWQGDAAPVTGCSECPHWVPCALGPAPGQRVGWAGRLLQPAGLTSPGCWGAAGRLWPLQMGSAQRGFSLGRGVFPGLRSAASHPARGSNEQGLGRQSVGLPERPPPSRRQDGVGMHPPCPVSHSSSALQDTLPALGAGAVLGGLGDCVGLGSPGWVLCSRLAVPCWAACPGGVRVVPPRIVPRGPCHTGGYQAG